MIMSKRRREPHEILLFSLFGVLIEKATPSFVSDPLDSCCVYFLGFSGKPRGIFHLTRIRACNQVGGGWNMGFQLYSIDFFLSCSFPCSMVESNEAAQGIPSSLVMAKFCRLLSQIR